MVKKLPLIIAVAASLLLSGCNDNTESATVKIVDVEKVLAQSSLLTQESVHLNKVKETLLAGKKAATANYARMSREDAQKAALADKLLLEKSWNQQRTRARTETLEVIYTAVEKYRAEQKIKLVAHKTAIIAGDAGADISDEIVTRLKGQQIKYAPLPEVSTRSASAAPADASPTETQKKG